MAEEKDAGVGGIEFYTTLQVYAEITKKRLLAFLCEQKNANKKIAAYGAAAKGNTLLNFAGVGRDLLPYVVDRSPGKIGKYLPGSHIPIVSENHLLADKPDWILILPWNLHSEIERQLAVVNEWGGRFTDIMTLVSSG